MTCASGVACLDVRPWLHIVEERKVVVLDLAQLEEVLARDGAVL
eukprot:CAMPEP_0119058660 /NCGR_PEP_ID=MMETSP1178-20130426/2941_1 /TAXON_ID=33656 /ORGANISM="unid sp, Strain CCMP2000" /LENGTH=43 /DNA_ID= /DNA_START= /DNA_END= /DNA_ORIENTATION=